MNGTSEGAALCAAAAGQMPAYLARLREVVAIDSGSADAAGVSAVAAKVAAYAREAGLRAERVPGAGRGDAVVARRRGSGTARILLAGHMDTVFAAGTAAERPYHVDDRQIARAPGVCDDKGGLLAGLAAIETLIGLGRAEYEVITLVGMPDEELGSPHGRAVLEPLARDADVALCLECARDNGDLVRARKGVTDVEVVLRGRAAHAGIEPEKGANAVLAAARLTTELQGLTGRWPGVTTNVGVIEGGDAPNVVAAGARLVCEVRAGEVASYDAALAEIDRLAAAHGVPGVAAEITALAPMPPWEGGPGTDWLIELATRAGRDVGIAVAAAVTGGGGDANLIAATGTPVLDGLGPVGGNDHSADEWLDLASVAPRVALLAGLVDRLSREPGQEAGARPGQAGRFPETPVMRGGSASV